MISLQPMPAPMVTTVVVMSPTWTKGLCDCMDLGCNTCLYAFFCSHCAAAQARTDYDGSEFIFNCCCMTLPGIRNTLREGYHIEGDCLGDILLSMYCRPCVVAQMMAEVQARGGRGGAFVPGMRAWRSGLCDCFNDCGTCMFGLCCPVCAIASARSSYDRSNFLFNCLCMHPAVSRNIVRQGLNIKGDCLDDLMTTLWCMHCAATQLLREVESKPQTVIVAGNTTVITT